MGFLANWKEYRRKKADIVVVAKITSDWTDNAKGEKKPFELHYVLYENALGKRSYTFGSTIPLNNAATLMRRDENWMVKVEPWIRGAYVDGINSFEEAKQDICVKKLTK
jgi:hypothetical protein